MTDTGSDHHVSLLRTLSLLLLGIVLFLAGLVLYLQTSHAFQNIILPLVAARVPGDLRINNGSLTFPATLELTGVSYQQPERGQSLQIDKLHVRISVMAWLREHLLFIEELDVENGNLHLSLGMTRPPQQGDTTVATAGETTVMIPIAVQHARVNHVALSIQTSGNEFTVRDLKLAIDDVVPGRTGTIDLRSEVLVNRSADQSRWAGALLLTGTLDETSDGRQWKWTVSHALTVREWPGQGVIADSKQITLDQTMSGRYDVVQATVYADSSVTLRQGETALGDVSLTLTQTESPDGTIMDVGVKLQKVTDEALNLVLGNDEAFRLHSSKVSGDVTIHAIGERYDIRSVFTGQQLQAASDHGTTPPVDVDVAQAGIFDLGSHDMTLDIFDLRVAEREHVLLAGELQHALTINLGMENAAVKGIASQKVSQPDWLLTINEIGVADLRQWCDAFGWKGLHSVRKGQMNGTVALIGRQNGTEIDVSAHFMISDVRMVRREVHTDSTSLTFAHDIQGTVTNLTSLRMDSWIVTASAHDRSVGVLRLSGIVDLRAPSRDPRLEGSLTLTSLPGEVWNPMLALWSDARINRGLFNGTMGIKLAGDLLSWEIDLRGNQISFRLSELRHATAPLDLVVRQSGSFEHTTGVLRLDKVSVAELDRSRTVITAALNKPVRFAIPGKAAGGKTLQLDSQDAVFTVQAHHLGIDQLGPRMAVWGISALNGVRTGIIDGRWIVQAQGDTGALSVAGTFDVTNLRLDAGALRIGIPVRIRSRIAATITKFSHIQVEVLSVEALAGRSLIAKVKLTGQTNVDDGSTDLAATFNTGSIATLLDRIGLLDERQRTVFTGGQVSAKGYLKGHGHQHPVSAQGTISVHDLRFQPLQDHFLTYSFLTEGTAQLNAGRTDIEINKIGMTLKSQGKPAGTFTFAGTWPIAASKQGGAVTVVAKDLDTAPLMDLFGVFPGREQGPLPVSADVAITRDSVMGGVVVRGQETLGPIRVARKAEGGNLHQATLRIEHDLSRQDDEIRLKVLTVTADRPGGRPDHMTAGGIVKMSGKPGTQINAEIASLDAAWYSALFSKPEPGFQTSTNQEQKDGEGKSTQSNRLAFPMNFNADLSIGSLSYNQLMIGPGRVIAKGIGEQLEIKMEPTIMAGGRVNATTTLARQGTRMQLTWSGTGQGLNVESIMQAAQPGREAVLKGTASFVTSGSRPLNEESFRARASGTFDFTVMDGQVLHSPLFQFLAKYTHLSELEQMGFDAFQGNMRLEDGWIHGDSLAITGSLASLEGNASVSPDDMADGRIFVKIGPSLAKKINIPCMSALLKTPDEFTALPVAIRINGSRENPTFSPDSAAWNYAKGGLISVADAMKNLVRGCREDRQEERAQ